MKLLGQYLDRAAHFQTLSEAETNPDTEDAAEGSVDGLSQIRGQTSPRVKSAVAQTPATGVSRMIAASASRKYDR